ncbi:MAG: hypothetical protein JNK82_24630 [Myxococcaceae bacterium]|nr:hypothetical protein [Myxococcaceae bacterium]
MTDPERHFEGADADRARLRVAVAAVGKFIAHLPSAHSGPDRGLTEAWAELVKLLALGPERQLRTCPRCGHVGMRDATLCIHCWARLSPLPHALGSEQVAGGGADS